MENQVTEKVELSWSDFRKRVMELVTNIIDRSNCSTFKMLGYKHLDIRLILYFDDCNQVFDFSKGEFEVEVTKFYTKEISFDERMIQIKSFKEEFERDLPE